MTTASTHAKTPKKSKKKKKKKNKQEEKNEQKPDDEGNQIFGARMMFAAERKPKRARSSVEEPGSSPEEAALKARKRIKAALKAWESIPATTDTDDWRSGVDPASHWRSLIKGEAECTREASVILCVREMFSVPSSSVGMELGCSEDGRAFKTRRAKLKSRYAKATIFMHENAMLGRVPWNTRQ